MKFEIVTLFPGYFESVVKQSIIGKGLEKKLFDIEIIDLRSFTTDKHRTADDKPFGGGGGMVLKVEPIAACLRSLGYDRKNPEGSKLVLTSAAGRTFDQPSATRWSLLERLTILCGHYLGVDERVLDLFEIEEISIGDYVLTGGEPAAAVMLDSVARLIPGVLGNFESAMEDSHSETLLGCPVYTRPEEFEGLKVPEELLSGNHAGIEKYRYRESLKRTFERRPELLTKVDLDKDDKKYLNKLKKETEDK